MESENGRMKRRRGQAAKNFAANQGAQKSRAQDGGSGLASGKKREKHWDSLALHFGKLGVKPDVIAHLRAQDKPELVATLIKKLMEKG